MDQIPKIIITEEDLLEVQQQEQHINDFFASSHPKPLRRLRWCEDMFYKHAKISGCV